MLFALEGLKLVLDTLAGMPGTTGTLENSLGSCKTAFFSPPWCSVANYRKKFCVCLCLWGRAVHTVKFLVLMSSEKNGNCTPRRPEKQKANKRNIILTWKSNGYWKLKNVLSLELSSSCFFFFLVSLQWTIMVLSTVKLSDRRFFQLFFLPSDEKQFPVNEQQPTAESSPLSRGFKTWAR